MLQAMKRTPVLLPSCFYQTVLIPVAFWYMQKSESVNLPIWFFLFKTVLTFGISWDSKNVGMNFSISAQETLCWIGSSHTDRVSFVTVHSILMHEIVLHRSVPFISVSHLLAYKMGISPPCFCLFLISSGYIVIYISVSFSPLDLKNVCLYHSIYL